MHPISIVDFIKERLGQDGVDLPVFDPVALKLQYMLARGNCGAKEISKIIEKDQALVSSVLKFANSSFYSGLTPVKTTREAIVRLGTKSVANMVMLVTQRQAYRSQNRQFRELMGPLWSHALGVAVGSRWLARHLGLERLAEESFIAGLLHDIGKLLLLKILEDLQNTESAKENITERVIHEIIDTMHCEQGESLMRHLNMPKSYCDVAAKHHDAELSGEDLMVNLVRLANLACHKLGIGLKNDPGLMLSTTPEAINLMADDVALAKLQVKIEDYKASVDNLLGHYRS
jgi:HD-like signal output (HDOD) protein